MTARFKKLVNKGFTLIELVVVIVILAIVGTGLSNFIGLGADIYLDAVGRDQVVSQTRYAMERLTREIREALPNSIRVKANGLGTVHCIEFIPIVASSTYINIPVAPESDHTDVILVQPPLTVTGAKKLVVYPLTNADVYTAEADTGNIFAYDGTLNAGYGTATVTLDRSALFDADSPTARYYIVDNGISYCVNTVNGQLKRYSGYWPSESQETPTDDVTGVLMAENFQAGSTPFSYSSATLVTNAVVQFTFAIDRNNEVVTFHHEVHLVNVP